MNKSVLVRDLSDADVAWLDENKPAGWSRNDFLKDLIARQRDAGPNTVPADTQGDDQKIRYVDLFAGIGGFRCGMTAAGAKCVFTNEWDKFAQKTYKAWYGSEDFSSGDIREAATQALIPKDFEILCGGFPCQPFSLAGVSKKNSLGRLHGFEDEKQGNLFFAITDIIDTHRPPVVFLENVPHLKSHDKGNTWRVIKQELEDRRYEVFADIVSADRWVPQKRQRFFIVCFDRDVFGPRESIGFSFPDYRPNRMPRLGDILEAKPGREFMLSDALWKYLKDYRKKHEAKGNGFGCSVFGPDDVTRTISARYHKDGSEVLIQQPRWRNPRKLTPTEAIKLMGFDEKYARLFGHEDGFPQIVSPTQTWRQCGNAVVPAVVEAIGTQIVTLLNDKISEGRLRTSQTNQ